MLPCLAKAAKQRWKAKASAKTLDVPSLPAWWPSRLTTRCQRLATALLLCYTTLCSRSGLSALSFFILFMQVLLKRRTKAMIAAVRISINSLPCVFLSHAQLFLKYAMASTQGPFANPFRCFRHSPHETTSFIATLSRVLSDFKSAIANIRHRFGLAALGLFWYLWEPWSGQKPGRMATRIRNVGNSNPERGKKNPARGKPRWQNYFYSDYVCMIERVRQRTCIGPWLQVLITKPSEKEKPSMIETWGLCYTFGTASVYYLFIVTIAEGCWKTCFFLTSFAATLSPQTYDMSITRSNPRLLLVPTTGSRVGVIRTVAGLAPPHCRPRYGRPLRGRLELHYDRPEDRFLRKAQIYLLKRILSSRRSDPRSGARNGARSGRT